MRDRAEEATRWIDQVYHRRKPTSKIGAVYVACCKWRAIYIKYIVEEMKLDERMARIYLSKLVELGLLGIKPAVRGMNAKRYFVIPNPDPGVVLSLQSIKSRDRDGRGSKIRVKKEKDSEFNFKPMYRNPMRAAEDLRRAEESKRRADEEEKRRAEEAAKEKQRADRLKAAAEKLKDLPAGDIESASHFIVDNCTTSEFTWPAILNCAQENGFVTEKSYVYCGSNNAPDLRK